MLIDLRSDTFTQPTQGMLEAIMNARTGDDVFGEDPTVNELERRMAGLFGMEAALYCPTGTMSNQVAIKVHTQAGDEVICEQNAHIYIYEGGGIALNSGSQVRALPGKNGLISAAAVEAAINPDDVHKARTSLVALENTSNRGGGSCYDWDTIESVSAVCKTHRLSFHLDGARLFNALVKMGQKPEMYGKVFNSISVCLNKGLGCPMGSVLLGNAAFIKQARRIRKVFGGGMRQAGYMAAAGLYALDHHIERLAEDHVHARRLAEAWRSKSFVKEFEMPETNILIFSIEDGLAPNKIVELLNNKGIRCMAISPTQIRMVTHLDVSGEMVDYCCGVIEGLSV